MSAGQSLRYIPFLKQCKLLDICDNHYTVLKDIIYIFVFVSGVFGNQIVAYSNTIN